MIEKLLTQSKKEELKRIANKEQPNQDDDDQENNEENETNDKDTENDDGNTEPETEREERIRLSEDEMKMKDELIAMYYKTKNEEMDKRVKPNKYAMHHENKEKMKSMNKVLTTFIREEMIIDITDLNALHYSAAVILAGVQTTPQDKPEEKPDP